MSHYLIELAFFMLMAYIVGCLFGWFLRNVFGTHPEVAAVAVPVVAVAAPVVVAAAAVAAPVLVRPAPIVPPPLAPRPAPIPVATPVAMAEPVGKMERPRGLPAARGGKADNLQRISGIGPKNESILHNLGVFHFDQIAAWNAKEVTWVDDHLRFNGRIIREEWVRQAGLLATGKESEFMSEFGTGGIKGKDGQTHSGSHTRKR